MESSLTLDTLGYITRFLTLKDILSLATTNPENLKRLMDPEINTQLAIHFGYPFGLSFLKLKKYESMSLDKRLIGQLK